LRGRGFLVADDRCSTSCDSLNLFSSVDAAQSSAIWLRKAQQRAP